MDTPATLKIAMETTDKAMSNHLNSLCFHEKDLNLSAMSGNSATIT